MLENLRHLAAEAWPVLVWLSQRIQSAKLEGVALLVTLLVTFFAGAYFAIRRMRLSASVFWSLVLSKQMPDLGAGDDDADDAADHNAPYPFDDARDTPNPASEPAKNA